MDRANILGVGVSYVNMQMALAQVEQWIERREPNYVVAAPAHCIAECLQSESLREVYNRAGMVIPDGRPVAWICRAMGHRNFRRYGISGERMDAAEALRVGLVHQLCTPQKLDSAIADGRRAAAWCTGGDPRTQVRLRRDRDAAMAGRVGNRAGAARIRQDAGSRRGNCELSRKTQAELVPGIRQPVVDSSGRSSVSAISLCCSASFLSDPPCKAPGTRALPAGRSGVFD